MAKSKVTDADRARILLADGNVVAMDISSVEARYIVEHYGLRYVIRQTPKKTIITMVGKADGQKT
jgi:hypothetical protein